MSYAQKNYPQTQGINGRYSIANIGCFLTAFCNLESDYSNSIDPLALNSFFVNNQVYIDVDDGVRDDLAWGSVSRYDPHTTVGHTSDHGTDQTAGWPSTNQSIVRFYYQSINHPTLANGRPNMIFHFCKIADASAHLIIDSWDGEVKKSPYGEPTAWAEYVHTEPAPPKPAPAPTPKFQVVETYPGGKQIKLNKQPTNLWGMNYDFDFMKDHPVEVHNAGEVWAVTNKVHHVDGYDYYRREGQVDGFNVADCDDYTPPPPPPPPAPPSAPLPIPTSTTPYQVVKTIKGYGTSNTAINDVDAKGTVEEGIYYIFNRRLSVNGNELLAVNVTKTPGRAGAWINAKDNVVDPPTPPPQPEPITVSDWSQHPTTPEPQPEPEQDWRTSYVTFKDAHGNPAPRKYIAMKDLKVVDYEMKRSDQDWHQYKDSEIAGTFIKDNVRIARPQFFADKYLWLGVPEVDPVTGMPNIELYEEVYNAKTTAPERKVLRTQTTIDHIGEIKSILEKDFQRVFDIVKPKKRK